jgi:23S rRNA (cytosine1962-C5)-methyltransferase
VASSPVIRITPSAAAALRRGHPWVWRDAVLEGNAAVGDVVRIAERRDKPAWRGIFDPNSPLAVRVWGDDHVEIDAALVSKRTDRAITLREQLFSDGQTNAYRFVHGEGDRIPGIVVDRYGEIAVVQLDGEGAEALFGRFGDGVLDALRAHGISAAIHRRRNRRTADDGPRPSVGVRTGTPTDEKRPGGREAKQRGAGAPHSAEPGARVLFGPEPPDTIEVREHGVPFVVDLARGQKTGTFLDQRENRRRVASLAAGKRMLNLFSYAGGFSLHAALRDAEVTSVDIAAGAHATAQSSFRLAGVDPKRHAFVTADAFAYLAEAKRKGQKWDVVVSDPPSFAPNEKSLPRALQAYRALHRACAEVLAPGGLLCAASCSSHVDADAFMSTLDDASLGRSDLRMLELHGPPADHPTLPAFPEGRYLKLAILG